MIADVAGCGITVHDGHHEVHDDEIVLFPFQQEYCLLAVAGYRHRGAGEFEDSGGDLLMDGVIVNDEYGYVLEQAGICPGCVECNRRGCRGFDAAVGGRESGWGLVGGGAKFKIGMCGYVSRLADLPAAAERCGKGCDRMAEDD